jgi:hypothetical protein
MIADVVLLLCTSPIPWQSDSPVLGSPEGRQQETTVICSLALSLSSSDFKVPQLGNVVSMWGLWQHTLLGIAIGLLKYVGPQATHFTEYCCWFMWGLGQHTLLGIVVGFMWGLGQHTLLGIVVWSTWASGNTHYRVLLLVYVGPRATYFTGYCCWFAWGLGQHTLLGLMWAFSNGLKITKSSVDFRISSETTEANNTLTNKIICHYFPIS